MVGSSSSSTSSSLPANLNLLISNLNSFITVKLDSTNFLIWRSQFENILRATNLLEFAIGSVPCPSLMITDSNGLEVLNPDRATWNKTDAHLLSCITATLTPIIFSSILHLQHSFEVWTALCKCFTMVSRSHIHQIKNRLTHLTKGSKSIEEYLTQIKELADQLALASSPMDDEDLVLLTLNGLPDEFDALKTTVRARIEPISMVDLTSLLCSESLYIGSKQRKMQSHENTVAYVSLRDSTSGSSSSREGRSSFRSQRGGFRGSFRGNGR
ncbi:hypothetical protein CsSME_00012575 [Camellia sinensis var. sinensis]